MQFVGYVRKKKKKKEKKRFKHRKECVINRK